MTTVNTSLRVKSLRCLTPRLFSPCFPQLHTLILHYHKTKASDRSLMNRSMILLYILQHANNCLCQLLSLAASHVLMLARRLITTCCRPMREFPTQNLCRRSANLRQVSLSMSEESLRKNV